MSHYRLVIFDWDGTLMDSTDRIVTCMRAAARDLDMPVLEPDVVRGIIGLGLPEAIRTLYPGIDEGGVGAMRSRYATHFVAAEAEPSALFPGVEPVLSRLRERDMLLAVATGKSRKGLNRVWGQSGYWDWFHASRCADESRSKPHPAMVFELLEALSVQPNEAVVVGDTTFDLEMASAAGVDAIGVTYGAHQPARLRTAQPLSLVEQIDHVLPLLGIMEEQETG